MNDKNDINKIVLASLASLLLGSLFFASGISIDSSFLPSIVNYVIAMLMFIASFLSVKNNNKNKEKILSYIMYLALFMMIFITIILVIQTT